MRSQPVPQIKTKSQQKKSKRGLATVLIPGNGPEVASKAQEFDDRKSGRCGSFNEGLLRISRRIGLQVINYVQENLYHQRDPSKKREKKFGAYLVRV